MNETTSDLDLQCSGVATPALIFVHGGFCNRHDWDAQVRALSSRHRTIVFDLPGHGRRVPAGAHSIAAFARIGDFVARLG